MIYSQRLMRKGTIQQFFDTMLTMYWLTLLITLLNLGLFMP